MRYRDLEAENVRLRERLARLETAHHASEPCPLCAVVKMECADRIAAIEIDRLKSKTPPIPKD